MMMKTMMMDLETQTYFKMPMIRTNELHRTTLTMILTHSLSSIKTMQTVRVQKITLMMFHLQAHLAMKKMNNGLRMEAIISRKMRISMIETIKIKETRGMRFISHLKA